jgi:hypothetical protein
MSRHIEEQGLFSASFALMLGLSVDNLGFKEL